MFFGCLNYTETVPEIIIEPAFSSLIATDTFSSGNYKTFSIGAAAATTYESINDYKGSIGLDYLNVVSNIYKGLSGLAGKFGLYHPIFLDKKRFSFRGTTHNKASSHRNDFSRQ